MNGFSRSHEIPFPEDRGMRKFLWFGYFHDSEILSVDFSGQRCDAAVVRVLCRRDECEEYRRLSGTREERLHKIDAHPERYTYLLRFERVRYFRHTADGDMTRDQYLYGAFLDSAALKRLQKEENRKLYHFRMDTAQGRIDLIFDKFSIRKEAGRVNYSLEAYDHWGYGRGVSEEACVPVWNVPEEQEDDNEYDKDIRMACLLKSMEQNADAELVCAARSCLKSDLPFDESKPMAIALLGRYGDASDVPMLQQLLLEVPREIEREGYRSLALEENVRMDILDAMDRIALRIKEEGIGADASMPDRMCD